MTGVDRVVRDRAASGRRAAALRPGESATATLRTSAPAAQVQVRVRGARCRLAPELELAVDGGRCCRRR